MTSIFLCIIAFLLTYIAVYIYKIHAMVEIPKEKKIDIPVGVTRGSYAPISTSSNDTPVGISESKTPQLIEYEAEQELLKRNQLHGN